ncbi:MAG: GTP-binding protein [Methanomassiliicoccales archaeon]|nr:MAG: GTP-binding protein [Methanomassiliicoccales archaeon]
MPEKDRLKFKICMIGEGNVGKTSLIRKFVLDIFEDSYVSTIGMKTTKKEFCICDPRNGEPVDICFVIWDIMGQPGFRQLLKGTYFFGASGFIVICDVTRKDTLYALPEWLKICKETAGDVPVVFLGNKCDLVEEQEVYLEDIKAFASNYGCESLFLSSAKTGENVGLAFRTPSESILTNMAERDKR